MQIKKNLIIEKYKLLCLDTWFVLKRVIFPKLFPPPQFSSGFISGLVFSEV